jgi:Disaggregatase related repeat/Dockerin type I domain
LPLYPAPSIRSPPSPPPPSPLGIVQFQPCQSTILEIYRLLPWDQSYVTWNNRNYNTPWINKGGDWYDRTNAAQGNAPYASVTFDASTLPDNRYYDLDVTELVQGYVNGTYNNTGFFLKAKDENDNYIVFYSSDWSNASQCPKLVINTSGVSFAIEDINQDGSINQTDMEIIQNSINTNTLCQRCDVNRDGVVDIYDVTLVSVKV